MCNSIHISRIELREKVPNDTYLYGLPVVKHLSEAGKLEFTKPVTFLVGENGIGKSTLVEGIAVCMGFNPEGGTLNFNFSTFDSHSELYKYLTVWKTANRIKDGFFLRAESFYNVASYVDEVGVVRSYGCKSLHDQSHGESFLSLIENRFAGNGIYILDEPEAALSPNGLMKLMVLIHELVKRNSQFIISTHSPILMSFPNSSVYQLKEEGINLIPYQETEHFQFTKAFINAPEKMLKYLLED